MSATFIWILAIAVTALILLYVLTLRRHRGLSAATLQQHAAEREQHANDRDRLQQSLTSTHNLEMSRLQQVRKSERTDLVAQNEDLNDKLEDARAFFRKGMKWDLASRNTIVDVCKGLGVSGFLATNVVFDPPTTTKDKRFAAQADHLLVTDAFTLIIENKRWKGLVIADRLPRKVSPFLPKLISESELREHFAIQIAPDSGPNALLKVRTHTAGSAPCVQVRHQAQRLSDLVEVELGINPWISTCVFYSHEDSHFEGPRTCTSTGGAQTEIAVGSEGLRSVIDSIRKRRTPRSNPSQTRELGTLCSVLGADIVGFGDYKELWGKTLVSAP